MKLAISNFRIEEGTHIYWMHAVNFDKYTEDEIKRIIESEIGYDNGHVPVSLIWERGPLYMKDFGPDTKPFEVYDIKSEYTYRQYTGKTEGTVKIHSIDNFQEGESEDDFYNRLKEGQEFTESIVPSAINRVGCYCCYGDGPDLFSAIENGKINFYVNFDFDASEYRSEY